MPLRRVCLSESDTVPLGFDGAVQIPLKVYFLCFAFEGNVSCLSKSYVIFG